MPSMPPRMPAGSGTACQMPARSGLPSAVRGVGALRLGLPSLVRASPLLG